MPACRPIAVPKKRKRPRASSSTGASATSRSSSPTAKSPASRALLSSEAAFSVSRLPRLCTT
jgi:hypothetical protein